MKILLLIYRKMNLYRIIFKIIIKCKWKIYVKLVKVKI